MSVHTSFLHSKIFLLILLILAITAFIGFGILGFTYFQGVEESKKATEQKLNSVEKTLNKFKNQDQYKRNEVLQAEIKNINSTYKSTLSSFEKIQDIKVQKQDTSKLDAFYSSILADLAEKKYASAQATLMSLNKEIEKKSQVLASATNGASSSNVAVSNTPPTNGFSRQQVQSAKGTFIISIISADLNSTRVIVDTASDSDCNNNCPVLSLSDYITRNNAFAGINGTFFCPTEYPSCAEKTNSFDTLLMNKNKHYFNSDNNKYSTIPLVYFIGNTMGVRGQSLEWGRDTNADSVIANHPLYVVGGKNTFGGSSDPKITNKGTRCFIGNKGNMVYIGIVYNASAEDAASVLTTLQLDNALGLDQGGSTALWYGGYKAGPGRNIPNAILFIRK